MKHLAIVDDDLELCELLKNFLEAEGFAISSFHHPTLFLTEPWDRTFDLLILDVMLPGMSGLELLKKIRHSSGIPVVMLTARGEELDRIVGLELGADDYLPKPFRPRELLARIRAVLRRSAPSPETGPDSLLQVGCLRLHLAGRKVFLENEELSLTGVEFRLLEVLMQAAGTVVKRQDLAIQVLERTLSYEDRSLDVHVSNLRRKILGSDGTGPRIETVRGVGYVLPKALEVPV